MAPRWTFETLVSRLFRDTEIAHRPDLSSTTTWSILGPIIAPDRHRHRVRRVARAARREIGPNVRKALCRNEASRV